LQRQLTLKRYEKTFFILLVEIFYGRVTKFTATKCRFGYTAVRTNERGFSVHPVYLARVCMCMEVPSVSAGTAHSVSRGVPPGTAELTENFATRGGKEGARALPAAAPSTQSCPTFSKLREEKQRELPIRSCTLWINLKLV